MNKVSFKAIIYQIILYVQLMKLVIIYSATFIAENVIFIIIHLKIIWQKIYRKINHLPCLNKGLKLFGKTGTDSN